MQIADELLEKALLAGFVEQLKSYNSPLTPIIKGALEKLQPQISGLISETLNKIMASKTFQTELVATFQQHMLKTLLTRFDSELGKQVNTLKSDPATRARIGVALADIFKSPAS